MKLLRALLLNRVTVTFGAIAAVVLGWNLYVAANDDGILGGRVVTPDGRPARGAEVVLAERTLVSLTPIAIVRADPDGAFEFGKHDRHHVVLTASLDGVGKTKRREVRLYFRNQNRRLARPLRLEPEPP